MLNLELNCHDPVVVLATTRTQATLHQRYGCDPYSYRQIMTDIKQRQEPDRPHYMFHSTLDKIYNTAIKSRLRFYRLAHLSIAAPQGDRPSKTYAEWAEWFDDIFREVEQRTRYNPNPVKPLVDLFREKKAQLCFVYVGERIGKDTGSILCAKISPNRERPFQSKVNALGREHPHKTRCIKISFSP